MANKKRIFCDGKELTLIYDGPQYEESLNLMYHEVQTIHFERIKERKFLFFQYDSEKIEIKPSKLSYSIVYNKSKSKKYFEEYKSELEKFAKENKVTFYNNL